MSNDGYLIYIFTMLLDLHPTCLVRHLYIQDLHVNTVGITNPNNMATHDNSRYNKNPDRKPATRKRPSKTKQRRPFKRMIKYIRGTANGPMEDVERDIDESDASSALTEIEDFEADTEEVLPLPTRRKYAQRASHESLDDTDGCSSVKHDLFLASRGISYESSPMPTY